MTIVQAVIFWAALRDRVNLPREMKQQPFNHNSRIYFTYCNRKWSVYRHDGLTFDMTRVGMFSLEIKSDDFVLTDVLQK